MAEKKRTKGSVFVFLWFFAENPEEDERCEGEIVLVKKVGFIEYK